MLDISLFWECNTCILALFRLFLYSQYFRSKKFWKTKNIALARNGRCWQYHVAASETDLDTSSRSNSCPCMSVSAQLWYETYTKFSTIDKCCYWSDRWKIIDYNYIMNSLWINLILTSYSAFRVKALNILHIILNGRKYSIFSQN